MESDSCKKHLFDSIFQLQGALADIEQEKFEMQKEHTKGIQDILEDTNRRLQKMEMEYNEQVDKHVSHTVMLSG